MMASTRLLLCALFARLACALHAPSPRPPTRPPVPRFDDPLRLEHWGKTVIEPRRALPGAVGALALLLEADGARSEGLPTLDMSMTMDPKAFQPVSARLHHNGVCSSFALPSPLE